MRARHRLQAQAFGAVVVLGQPPSADPQGMELEWVAPAGCPDETEARQRVTRFLGRPPGRRGDPDLRARVRITESEGRFAAEIELESEDGSGERSLEAQRCEVVADAAAYVIAAMIDPTVDPPVLEPDPAPATVPAAAEPAPPPAREVVRAPATVTPTPRPPRAPEARRPRLALRVGPALGIGSLPAVAPGIGGGAALLLRRLRVELLATHWFARPARLDGRPEVGGDIRLTTGAVRVCPLVVVRPIEVPLCGGFELGSMHGRGVGISEPSETRLPWAAFSVGTGFVWMPSRRVGPWLEAMLVVPVSRPVFGVENVGRVFQPTPAAFSGMLGVEVRFF